MFMVPQVKEFQTFKPFQSFQPHLFLFLGRLMSTNQMNSPIDLLNRLQAVTATSANRC
jgi:hypothetical protein